MTKVRILCAVHQYKKKFKSRLGATGTLGAWTLSTGVLLLRRERGSCMTMNDCWGVQMGSTVLHVACQRRREPVALMLVRLNCRTDLEDAVRCFTVFTHLGANCRSSGGVVGTGCTRDTEGRAFHSRPRAFSYQPWASCSHSCASVTKQYNLAPVQGRRCPAAGKVTVGLASHWPCVTDFSCLSTYGRMAYERKMSTPPMLLMVYGLLYVLLQSVVTVRLFPL